MTSVATHNLALKRQEQRVPMDLVGCHMMVIDGYVVEGYVSAGDREAAAVGVSDGQRYYLHFWRQRRAAGVRGRMMAR